MSNKEQKKPNRFARFLWWTAGADQDILLRSTHSDRVKYLTLGGIILATGLMAALAGGYAFYTIFSPKGGALADYAEVANTAHQSIKETTHFPTAILSIFFGVLWGLMIFNIDRFIVTSTGTGDGTEKITWDEFKSAIPRLVMGAIIAITISKPVEIRMFKSEIDAELHIAQQKQAAEYEEQTRAKYQGDLDRIQGEIDAINAKSYILLNDFRKAEEEYIKETQGGRGNVRGVGPIAKALNQKSQEKKRIYDDYLLEVKDEIDILKEEKSAILAKQKNDLANNDKVASALDGLLERIKLAHEIAGWQITLFITLLFLVIELTPIFFKLMLIKSPYDYLVENEKELTKARAGIHIDYNYYPAEDENGVPREGTERHLVRLLQIEKENLERLELLEAQKRLTQYAIKKFEENQMKLIDENPEKYISITEGEDETEA